MKNKEAEKPHQLPFELLGQVCGVIQDTGFIGNASEYVQKFYSKPFEELTICEAEILVRNLSTKPGCLQQIEGE